jgi:DNA replication protein DnaC
MEKANSPKSRFSEWMAELEAKKHCRCDGRDVHGHCSSEGCAARLPEGETECAACKERQSRRRSCQRCQRDYYVPPPGQEVPQYHKWHMCSQLCFESYLTDKMKWSGLPSFYRECTLGNFDAYTSSLKKKLSIVKDWVARDLDTGLYLFGPVGNGKSHLLAGVMRELGRRGIFGRYINGREFALRCQNSFSANSNSVLDIVDEHIRGEYLAIDDLASEKATEFVRQSLLELIDRAYTNSKVLLVTSNLTLDQLNAIEPRIASRLAEMCDLLEFNEADYRVRLAAERKRKLP